MGWCRIYHRSAHPPRAETFGPLARFDHHIPAPDGPAHDPDGRSLLYVAENLVMAACEVFGQSE